MRLLTLAGVAMVMTTAVQAEVRTKVVEYKQGDTTLEGYLAWDDSVQGRRPGVLVVHEWTGLGKYVKGRAEQLAKLGYVAFCADIYGEGVRPSTPQEAGATAGMYKKDRPLLRARVRAALDELRHSDLVDAKRMAAIGYCFGGTTVLELARSGADVTGVVSFHGGLDSPDPEAGKNIKAKILVLQGADDPYASASDVAAFQQELRHGGVDWQMVSYSGAVHSFTNPDAGNDPSKGAAYNATADRRSWEAMRAFFNEIFK